MPHLVMEYTANVAAAMRPQKLIEALSETLLASGEFKREDIKARAICHEIYTVGAVRDAGFIHVKVSILSGRAQDVKTALATSVMSALRHGVDASQSMPIPMSVEIADMDRPSYVKEVHMPAKEQA